MLDPDIAHSGSVRVARAIRKWRELGWNLWYSLKRRQRCRGAAALAGGGNIDLRSLQPIAPRRREYVFHETMSSSITCARHSGMTQRRRGAGRAAL